MRLYYCYCNLYAIFHFFAGHLNLSKGVRKSLSAWDQPWYPSYNGHDIHDMSQINLPIRLWSSTSKCWATNRLNAGHEAMDRPQQAKKSLQIGVNSWYFSSFRSFNCLNNCKKWWGPYFDIMVKLNHWINLLATQRYHPFPAYSTSQTKRKIGS